MNSRRHFFKTASTAAVCIAVPAIRTDAEYSPIHRLGCQDFTANLHSRFKVRGKGAAVQLQLTEARMERFDPRLENFSLHFQGPQNHLLSQGTYLFDHKNLGSFEVFIVPNVGDAGPHFYEAIFNHLIG